MTVGFFIALAWKSLLIAAVALVLALLLRSRSAADRAALLRAAMISLLLLPPLSLLLPALRIELGGASELVPLLAPDALAGGSVPVSADALAASPAVEASYDPAMLLAPLYLTGLALILLRLGAGIGTLRRWTRRAYPALNPFWTEPFDRLRRRAPGDARLLVSRDLASPLSWGWRRPVILIDPESHRRSDDAEAVLAHEMAHVARGDWRTLVLARLAVALFWFNPLVWLIERRLLEDAEEAADRDAIGAIEPTRYAQTLLDYAQAVKREPVPANGIASSPLARRVRAVLHREANTPSGSAWTKAAIGASIALAGPVAALEVCASPLPAQVAAVTPVIAGTRLAAVHAPMPAKPLVFPAIPHPSAAPAVPAVAIAARAADGTMEAPPAPPAVPQAPQPPAPPAAPEPPATPLTVPMLRPASFVTVDVSGPLRQAQIAIARATSTAAEQARIATQQAQREVARAHAVAARSFRLSMEQAARGMEQGAAGMEQGAQKMEEEARKLRSRSYREQKIAEAAARGKSVTHEELEETACGLEDGAQDMRDGAEDMRREAQEMRSERFEA